MSLLSRVIDAGLDPSTTDPGVLRRVRIVNTGSLAMFCIGVPTVIQYWSLGVPHMCLAVSLTMAGCVGNMWVLRSTLRPRLSGNIGAILLYLLLLSSNLNSGGFSHPNFAWLYVLPVAAAVLVDLRSAWIWVGIVSATTVGFWYLDQVGIEVPNVIPPEHASRQGLFNRLSAILALGLLSTSFVVGQRRAERSLEAANRELRRESGFVKLLQQVAAAANESVKLEEALARSVTLVCEATGWHVGHAYVPAPDGRGELEPTGLWHLESPERFAEFRERTEQARFAPGVGLPGRVSVSRRPAWIIDVTQDDNFPRAKLAGDLGVRAGVAFPVIADGAVVAVLEFYSDRPLSPDPRMLEVFAHIGEQLGRVCVRDRLEARLLQSQKIEAVGRLAAGLAHEINNPMAYVRTNLSLLRSDWLSLQGDIQKSDLSDPALERMAEFEELIDDSLEGVERTVALVREVRAFSHTGDVLRESAAIDKLLEKAVQDAAPRIAPGVAVALDLEEFPSILCSPIQLRQVFGNLLDNAAHAVGAEGNIRVRAFCEHDRVVVRVEDDGPGIAPDVLGRVFEPFFTTKPVGEGTGLGLYICFEIVRLHAGEIRVDSSPGAGTRFEVSLPLRL